MTLSQETAGTFGDLVRQVGFPVLTAAYFMWRDHALIKDLVKGNAENHAMLQALMERRNKER